MAIKFETNIPLKLQFPYGDFRETQSEYGQQFAYTVSVGGQRDKLFATPALHHKLQEFGVRAGAAFTITKIETEGNRKDWKIEAQGKNGKEEKPTPQKHKEKTPVTQGQPANGHSAQEPPSTETPEFERLRQAIQHCLNASYGAWEGLEVNLPFTTEDVRAVGITLFLECSRKGILPQATEEVPF